MGLCRPLTNRRAFGKTAESEREREERVEENEKMRTGENEEEATDKGGGFIGREGKGREEKKREMRTDESDMVEMIEPSLP